MTRRRPVVLVVEDDVDLRELLATMLGLLGAQVETAGNGLEGLQSFERRLPELILLDMRMPVMNGWEFTRELDRRGTRPPIVVITAAPDPSERAAEIGAEGWLGKPFDMHELTDMVRRFAPDLAGVPD